MARARGEGRALRGRAVAATDTDEFVRRLEEHADDGRREDEALDSLLRAAFGSDHDEPSSSDVAGILAGIDRQADRSLDAFRGEASRRYDLHEEIGRGGMGVVYRAQDEKFDAEVAVKVLTLNQASADAAARLKREAKLGNLLGRQDGLVRALEERETLRRDLVDRAAPFTWDACAERVEGIWKALA